MTTLKKLQTAYNRVFRKLMRFDRDVSISAKFVQHSVDGFKAVWRNWYTVLEVVFLILIISIFNVLLSLFYSCHPSLTLCGQDNCLTLFDFTTSDTTYHVNIVYRFYPRFYGIFVRNKELLLLLLYVSKLKYIYYIQVQSIENRY